MQSPENSIAAKARLLRLTATILRGGPADSVQKIVAEMPSLSDVIESVPEASLRFGILDRDAAYRQSAYVDREDRAELDRQLLTAFSVFGTVPDTSVPTDHISNHLEHLARLLMQSAQNEMVCGFVMSFIAPWIFPLSSSIKRLDSPLSSTLITSIVEMLGHSLPAPETVPHIRNEVREAGFAIGSTMSDAGVYISRPDLCGMFVSRDAILELGREVGVPAGFGSRREMCRVLFDGAERYGQGAALLNGVLTMFRDEHAFLESMLQGGLLEASRQSWLDRVSSTIGMIELMVDKCQDSSITPEA